MPLALSGNSGATDGEAVLHQLRYSMLQSSVTDECIRHDTDSMFAALFDVYARPISQALHGRFTYDGFEGGLHLPDIEFPHAHSLPIR